MSVNMENFAIPGLVSTEFSWSTEYFCDVL